jgi:hypothetical protein
VHRSRSRLARSSSSGLPLRQPAGLAGLPPRAGNLMSAEIPYGYLGLVVIGRQIALSYADVTGLSNDLLTRGSDLLRHPEGGDHVLRKVITWAIVIFIVYYLATDPSGAAHFLQHAFNGLKSAGNSMSRFVNKL